MVSRGSRFDLRYTTWISIRIYIVNDDMKCGEEDLLFHVILNKCLIISSGYDIL